MKNIIKYILLVLFIASIFSCNRQEEFAPASPKGQTLVAHSPGHGNENVYTKLSFKEDDVQVGNINVSWQVGDLIDIYEVESGIRISVFEVVSVNADTGKATFEAIGQGDDDAMSELEPGVDYIAAYPFDDYRNNLYDNYQEPIREKLRWWYAEMIPDIVGMESFLSGDLTHLDRVCFMKSAPFSLGETMSFAYETAMMTIECALPDCIPSIHLYDVYDSNEESNRYDLSYDLPPTINYIKLHIMIAPTAVGQGNEHAVFLQGAEEQGPAILFKETTVPFEAGKHYIFSNPIKLADVSASNVPGGQNWLLGDTDETAGSVANFSGLKEAIVAYSAQYPDGAPILNISLPNLTTLPSGAFADIQTNVNFRVSLGEVTTLNGGTFANSETLIEVEVPKATTLGAGEFSGATSLAKLHIALDSRVVATDASLFDGVTPSNIRLWSNESNIVDNKFKLSDNTLVGPFRDMNSIPVKQIWGSDGTTHTLVPTDTRQLVAYISPSNATYQDVIWTSSDESVATVDSKGKVTAIALGAVEIIATSVDNADIKMVVDFNIVSLPESYAVGDAYPYDGARPQSTVISVNQGGTSGITAMHGVEFAYDAPNIVWGKKGEISGAGSKNNGLANMRGILASNNGTFDGYLFFEDVHETNTYFELDTKGYADDAVGVWYLPAINELNAHWDVMKDHMRYSDIRYMWSSTAKSVDDAYYLHHGTIKTMDRDWSQTAIGSVIFMNFEGSILFNK